MLNALLLMFQAVAEAVPPEMPDPKLSAALAITALTPVVVPFLTFGFRKLAPKIPRVGLPFVAMGLGSLINFLASYAAGGDFTPVAGAALGLAGVGVREIANTWRLHGTSA